MSARSIIKHTIWHERPRLTKAVVAGLLVISVGTYVGHHRWQLVVFVSLQVILIGSLTTVGTNDRKQALGTIIALSSMVTPPNLIAFVMISLNLEDQSDM